MGLTLRGLIGLLDFARPLHASALSTLEMTQLEFNYRNLQRRESELHARIFLYREIHSSRAELESLPKEVLGEIRQGYLNCLLSVAALAVSRRSVSAAKDIILELGDFDADEFDKPQEDFLVDIAYQITAIDDLSDDWELLEGLFPWMSNHQALAPLVSLRHGFREYCLGNAAKALSIVNSLSALESKEGCGALILSSIIYGENSLPFEELSCLQRFYDGSIASLGNSIEGLMASGERGYGELLKERLHKYMELLVASNQGQRLGEIHIQLKKRLITQGFESFDREVGNRERGVELLARDRQDLTDPASSRELIRNVIEGATHQFACIVVRSEEISESRSYTVDDNIDDDSELLDGVEQALEGVPVTLCPAVIRDSGTDQKRWLVLGSSADPMDAIAVSIFRHHQSVSIALFPALFIDTLLNSSKDQSWFKRASGFVDRRFDGQSLVAIERSLEVYFESVSVTGYSPEIREY